MLLIMLENTFTFKLKCNLSIPASTEFTVHIQKELCCRIIYILLTGQLLSPDPVSSARHPEACIKFYLLKKL